MTIIKISELPAASSPVSTSNLVPVVQDNTTKKAQISDLEISSTQAVFLPAGTSAVTRNAQNKLRETVSLKDFGAVGDGVADDTAAVQAALNSEEPLDWGGLTYRITSTVSRVTTKDVFWQGRNATIVYDGTHAQRAVLLECSGVNVVLNDITVDGSKLVNKCLEILNNTDEYSNLTCNNVFVTRAKRLNTFSGGDGMFVRGSFNVFTFNGGGASDCELPAGQGTSGSVGITGVTATWYSTDRYIKAMYFLNARIEKIYSSDLSYQDDQDGIRYFSPTDGDEKIESLFSCLNSEFVNCYGRAIKTQCRETVVQASSFIRTEGLTSGEGNTEISAQTGNGNFRDLTFSYSNGQQPDVCVGVSGGIGYGKPSLVVDGCSVYLDGVTLDTFAQIFPRDSVFSRHSITNNKIFGTVTRLFDFLCNGDKNYAEVSNNYVEEIADGPTSEKILIYVRTSGSINPKYAHVYARGNVYAGSNTVYLGRDSVPGTGMNASWSALNNFGFVNNWNGEVNDANNPLSNQALAAKLTGLEDSVNKGYFGMQTKSIANGATETFNFRAGNASLIILQTAASEDGYAIFSVASSTDSIAVGSEVALGTTTNPGTGNFNVWRSGSGEISVENDSGTTRVVSVWVFAPN